MNGEDTAPRNLEKLFDQLKGMARLVKNKVRPTRGSRRVSYQRNPRQVCDICNSLFDYAIGPAVQPELTRCSSCKDQLAEGYTALIAISGWAFVKSSALKPGEVIKVSNDTLEKVKAKLGGSTSENEPTQSD